MRILKGLLLSGLALAVSANAGVVKFSAKTFAKSVKFAAKSTVKTVKVGKKVVW